jgi:Ca-activated chloride channel family protein
VAVSGAKPVVVDTKDYEVVRNILGDLPMHYAFPAGKTKLLSGLEEAVKLAEPWSPRSTTLVVLSDGDTVPGTGMPRLPASIRSVLVVGVGDPNVGKFIDGRQSRQDVPTLKQIAVRLGGTFHNGNDHHLSSALISDAMGLESESLFEKLTLRDYALIAQRRSLSAGLPAPPSALFSGRAGSPGRLRAGRAAPVPDGSGGWQSPRAGRLDRWGQRAEKARRDG